MKQLVIAILLIIALTTAAFADPTPPAPPTAPEATTVAVPVPVTVSATTAPVAGWGPAVVGSVGAFYLKGDYSLLSAGANFGAAYTWNKDANMSSIGVYAGPSTQQMNGVTTTNVNLMAYLDLFKTASGNFGLGLGTRVWTSGKGIQPDLAHTFLALGYHF